MPKHKLALVHSADAPKNPATLPVGEHTLDKNLRLFVTESGRYWRCAYRLHGKRRQYSLGQFPALDQKAASAAAKIVWEQAEAGSDPVAARKQAKAHAAETGLKTFAAVAEAWFARHKGGKSKSWTTNARRWVNELSGEIGRVPIKMVRPRDVLRAMEAGEKSVSAAHANNLRTTAHAILDYAVATDLIEFNFVTSLRKAIPRPAAVSHPDLTLPQVKRYIAAVEGTTVAAPGVRHALRMLPLTALRVSELVGTTWDEVDFDDAVIRIPARRMKGGTRAGAKVRDHVVPLSTQAVAALREAKKDAGESDYVFPGLSGKHDGPIHKSSLNIAIKRLGLKSRCSPHSFRSTFSTICRDKDLGLHDEIETSLAHALGGAVERSYNRAVLLDRRRVLMQRWADLICVPL